MSLDAALKQGRPAAIFLTLIAVSALLVWVGDQLT